MNFSSQKNRLKLEISEIKKTPQKASIVKPHQTVLNMQQREKERAERRKAAEERKRLKEIERVNQIKVFFNF